jgi:hypothetical protein
MMNINTKILTLDMTGAPRGWEDTEKVAEYYAKGKIAWEIGEFTYTLRGGVQRTTGVLSEITVRSIVAIKGTEYIVGKDKVPTLSRSLLFQRDAQICCYCNTWYDERLLEMEHVVPKAQQGKNTWMNLVTSCVHCNDIKRDRTPEQAGMRMYYQPYIPNRFESLILRNKRMLPDQTEFLMSKAKNIKQKGTISNVS